MKKSIISVSAPKCTVCGKSVYDMEKVQAIDQIWHKSCFTCGAKGTAGGCNKVLTLDKYLDHNGEPFCKTCHGKLYGPKGYGYGVGAGVLSNTGVVCSSEPTVQKLSRNESPVGDLSTASSKKMKFDNTVESDEASMEVSTPMVSPRMNVDQSPSSPRPVMETAAEDNTIEQLEYSGKSERKSTEEDNASKTVLQSDVNAQLPTTSLPIIEADKSTNEGNNSLKHMENENIEVVNSTVDKNVLAPPAVENNHIEPTAAPSESPRPSIIASQNGVGGSGSHSPTRDISTILGINKANTGVAKFGEGAPKCAVCKKSVYPAEKVQAIDQIWHVSNDILILIDAI